jgi:hypothetical protein
MNVNNSQFLRSPFQYFGGKSKIAAEVWRRFGNVRVFVDPFCGSNSILWARPQPWGVETINDIDGFIINFYRAVRKDPHAVAELMNWPVSEIDLEARHKALVRQPGKTRFLKRMRTRPDYCSVTRAAWWCWGLAQWIGGGWCGGEWFGPGNENNHGQGTCNNAGKLPHLRSGGMGVHSRLPHLGKASMSEHARRLDILRSWMCTLADRLRNVRICCGDWRRVLGPAGTFRRGMTAIFFDPPYSASAGRDNDIYRCEDTAVAHDVREWCLANGDNPLLRIALCGFAGEGHEKLIEKGWSVFARTSRGGYGVQRNGEYVNRFRERVWFSPHCMEVEKKLPLFDSIT